LKLSLFVSELQLLLVSQNLEIILKPISQVTHYGGIFFLHTGRKKRVKQWCTLPINLLHLYQWFTR